MWPELVSALVYGVIVAVALAVLAWIARGGPFRGRRVGSAARDAAIATFTAMQNADRREAVEEIEYLEEDWSEADREGDDGDRTAAADDERVTESR